MSAGSPCIDAGDNNVVPGSVTTDLDGNSRFVDDPNTDPDPGNGTPPIVDMGAYEYFIRAPGDFDGDGDVDHIDFGTFESCASGPAIPHNGSPTCQQADFDDDNDVDQDDFAIFQICYSGEGNPADAGCAD